MAFSPDEIERGKQKLLREVKSYAVINAPTKSKQVTLQLEWGKQFIMLDDEHPVGGYFDPDAKVLACAMGRGDSLMLLVHEMHHMIQWQHPQLHPAWKRNEEEASSEYYYEYLSGDLKSKKIGSYHIQNVLEMELECEIMSARFIHTNNLPINLNQYIQKANAYIYLYERMKTTRTWPSKKQSPIRNKSIWSKCPKEFLSVKEYSKIPSTIVHEFEKLGI